MAVPIFNNTKVGSSESSRVSTARTEEDFITPGIASVQERLGALAKIKEQQAENEGTGEYLKWNEEASAKSQELQLKNGSNAVGLEDEFNQWNDEYKNNLNFSSREAEQDFYDRASTSLSNYKKNIKTYEVKENFEYSNQLKEAEYSQANQNYVVALFNNDEKAQDDTKIKAMVAFEQLHAGQPQEFIDIEFQKSWDLTTTSVLDQMVRNGEVVQAFTTMEKANANKQVSDASKSLFNNKHKVSLSKSYGETRAESKVGEFTYYNNEEWAEKNGIDITDMTEAQKKMNSGNIRNFVERVTMAEKSLLKDFYKDETFFAGDNFFDKMVDNDTQSAVQSIKDTQEKTYKDSIDNIVESARDDISRFVETGDEKALESYNEKTKSLEENGEWGIITTLKSDFKNTIISDPEVFNNVMAGARTGSTTRRAINENMRLNRDDKKTLLDMLDKVSNINYANAEKISDKLVRDYLGYSPTKKINKLSAVKQAEYYQYSNAMITLLNKNFDNDPISQEDIGKMVEGAITSNKFDIDKFDDSTIETTLYDTDGDKAKTFIKKNNITNDEYINLVQQASASGFSGSETIESMQEFVDADKELNIVIKKQFNIDKFGKEVNVRIGQSLLEDGVISQSEANKRTLDSIGSEIDKLQKEILIKNLTRGRR